MPGRIVLLLANPVACRPASSVLSRLVPNRHNGVNARIAAGGTNGYIQPMRKSTKDDDVKRIVLSPNDEQREVFKQQMRRSGHTKMATWALARLWQAVQEDVAKQS